MTRQLESGFVGLVVNLGMIVKRRLRNWNEEEWSVKCVRGIGWRRGLNVGGELRGWE